VSTLRKDGDVYSEIAKEKMKKNEINIWGFIKGIIIFLKDFLLPVSLAISIRFLSRFFNPKEIMNIPKGKKDNVRKKIKANGL